MTVVFLLKQNANFSIGGKKMQEGVGSLVYKLKTFKVVSRYSKQCLQQTQQCSLAKINNMNRSRY